jgi:DNA polymerase-1
MIDAYLVRAYPKVRSLMEDKKAEARRFGYVRSMLGRIRYLPGIHSSNNKLRSEAERVSLNHDIQTSAQEIEKLGMAGIWQRVLPTLWSEGWYCEPILQIHDELILEMDEKIAPVVDVMIRNELEQAVKLVVPIAAKGSIATTWGALK